jgi:hypothetical protein
VREIEQVAHWQILKYRMLLIISLFANLLFVLGAICAGK